MKKFFESIGSILFIIFYFGLAFLFIGGYYHSYTKHSTKDFILTVMLPPLTLYRGAEMYWHKDPNETDGLSDKEWDSRIKTDLQTAIELINISNGKDNIDAINTQVNEFGNKISTYPKDKINFIKKGIKLYFKYNISVSNDMLKYLDDLNVDVNSSKFSYGYNTNKYADSLVYEYNQIEVKIMAEKMDSIFNSMDKSNLDTANISDWRTNTKQILSNYSDIYKEVYYKIFKEQLIL